MALTVAYLGWAIVLIFIILNENHGEEIIEHKTFVAFGIPDIDTTGTVEWIEPAKERVVGLDGGVYFKAK